MARVVSTIRKRLQSGDLSFREFMTIALFEPSEGYYARAANPVGKTADFVTAPTLSPLFSFALGRLIREFSTRTGAGVSTVVDMGCGDGSLIHSLYVGAPEGSRLYGVDRSLSRIHRAEGVNFAQTLEEVPKGETQIVIANEFFDALPFSRVVRRGDGLHELTVTLRGGELDWNERAAPVELVQYFAARGVELADGQFADIAPDWEREYSKICRFVHRGLIVTFDYGYPERQLFDSRVRRFGTAASYRGQQVSRDLLSDPGERDLTAHINFTDLIRAGEREGLATLFFDRQAKFLLALGAAEHESLRPIEQLRFESADDGVAALQRRDDARRLLLPDGIGEDIRVLVQGKNIESNDWSFQRSLFGR